MVDGLTPVMPSGALYMAVGIELSKFPHFNTTVEFMEKLVSEESVFVLCGEVGALSITMHAADFSCLCSVSDSRGSSEWCW